MSVRFTRDHEWIRVEDGIGTVGITDFAQKQLGDVVFVELPDVGQQAVKGEQAGVVESVKAASEVYAPASGEITETNEALADEPGDVNADPLGKGWFFKIKLSNPEEVSALLAPKAYQDYLDSLD